MLSDNEKDLLQQIGEAHRKDNALNFVPEQTKCEMQRTFSTGAKRDTKDSKSALELISPIFLDRLGMHLAEGALHYGERNWEAGIPLSVSVASLLRHINQYREGCQNEDHLAAIACNIMFIIHTEEMISRGILPGDLDDVPHYVGSNNG